MQLLPVIASPTHYLFQIFQEGITFLACTQAEMPPLMGIEVPNFSFFSSISALNFVVPVDTFDPYGLPSLNVIKWLNDVLMGSTSLQNHPTSYPSLLLATFKDSILNFLALCFMSKLSISSANNYLI